MSMSKFLNKLRRDIKAGKRFHRHGDPGKGIEYNKISTNYSVSRYLFSVDIARTPQIVRDDFVRVDIHAQSWKANSMTPMINYCEHRLNGRRGLR